MIPSSTSLNFYHYKVTNIVVGHSLWTIAYSRFYHKILGNFPKLRVRFFCLFLIWTINSGSYYGLTLNVKNLGGNFYINLLINALMEIPAISLIIFAVAKFNIGRRKILIFSYLFCGILNLLVSLIQTNWIVDSSEGTGKYMEISLGKCLKK